MNVIRTTAFSFIVFALSLIAPSLSTAQSSVDDYEAPPIGAGGVTTTGGGSTGTSNNNNGGAVGTIIGGVGSVLNGVGLGGAGTGGIRVGSGFGGVSSGGIGGVTGGIGVGTNFGGVSSNGSGIFVGKNWVGIGNNGLGGAYYNAQIDNAACRVLGIPEGSFGALVMIISGITAIVAAAMGGYKVAMSTIIIGTGAWILRPIVGLFFPLGCAGGIF